MFDPSLVNFKTQGKVKDVLLYEQWRESLTETEYEEEMARIEQSKKDGIIEEVDYFELVREQFEYDIRRMRSDTEFMEKLDRAGEVLMYNARDGQLKLLYSGTSQVKGYIRNLGLFDNYQARHNVFSIDGATFSLKGGLERILNPTEQDKHVFGGRPSLLDREDLMSSAEACGKWGIAPSTLRMNIDKFPQGGIRKFGKQWIVTEDGMIAVFGRPNGN